VETVTPFGTLLRRLRKAQDLSQEALALRAFCALDTVKKIESGRRRPSRQLADQLADALGLEATARTQFPAVARPAEVDAERPVSAPSHCWPPIARCRTKSRPSSVGPASWAQARWAKRDYWEAGDGA